jgi:hypothetical protein
MQRRPANGLIVLGGIIIVLGTINAIIYVVAKLGDPLVIAALTFAGVISGMLGKCLKTFDQRIAEIERQLRQLK